MKETDGYWYFWLFFLCLFLIGCFTQAPALPALAVPLLFLTCCVARTSCTPLNFLPPFPPLTAPSYPIIFLLLPSVMLIIVIFSFSIKENGGNTVLCHCTGDFSALLYNFSPISFVELLETVSCVGQRLSVTAWFYSAWYSLLLDFTRSVDTHKRYKC